MTRAVIWFTGLSGAGKTTIAVAVCRQLERQGEPVQLLDGDRVRASNAFGFSERDRKAHLALVAAEAAKLALDGSTVVVATISPYAESRALARKLVELIAPPFFEVYVATPIEVCIKRDPKGLYELAQAGKIENFTGISAPYEVPDDPDLTLHTNRSPEESADQVTAMLRSALYSLSP